jgi:hypothetical protein
MGPAERRRLSRTLLDAPRVYMSSDAAPVVDRGGLHATCAHASVELVNPGAHTVTRDLELTYDQGVSDATRGTARANGRRIPLTAERVNVVRVRLRPGTTTVSVRVDTPHVRCDTVDTEALPRLSATLRPIALDPASHA